MTLCLAPESSWFDADAQVDGARRAFAGGWHHRRWASLRDHLGQLVDMLPEARPDLRVEALTMLGAVTRHLGAPEASHRC